MRSAIRSGQAIGTVPAASGLAAALTALVPHRRSGGNRGLAPARSGWQHVGKGTWQTRHGPLTALDRDFIRKVRNAGLWELPAGQSARERGTRKSVRIAGDHLVDGYTESDRRAVTAGHTLTVGIPSRPPGPGRKRPDTAGRAGGNAFDRVLVERLRQAHGVVFGLAGLVRDQTRNSMVRSLATRANAIVLDHLTVLDTPGLWISRR
ncbi:uncharacterized protein DUF4142 [Streptomyces sp. Amel2xB2]|uniref:DUF4142 domain-containing protein n=1 Tax=Streptomyces sp. Amel2xB2 TaxID=1305829 RepID=UPI000DB9D68A|nr:DUF4142 domain-containing protein [Streptomyces sp. Amel2xB2]RAJ60542.1 uncharacterized protein DUF4142 [Streptomyces sp. Amel2xB2]